MLKAKKFGNRDKAIKKKVIPAINSQIQKQGEISKEISKKMNAEFGIWIPSGMNSTEITISF